MRSSLARAVLALALLVPACASGHGAADQGSPAPDDPVILDVANHTWSDVDVYILASTMHSRVGNVDSQGDVELNVPRDLWSYGTIQVRVVPVGGAQPFVTDAIGIHGGQRIRVSVEEQRGLSTWTVESLARW